MPSFSSLGKFFGRTASEGAAFAAGIAVAPALAPVVREVENEAWAKYQTKPLEPGDLAEIVGEDVERLAWGEDEAAKTGLKGADFDALVQAVLNALGVPELLTLWRRGLIDDAAFEHGLRKTRLEPRWDGPLKALKTVPLPPAVAALAAVRGLIDAEGTLPVAPPNETGKVPAFPVYPISGKEAAHAAGLTDDEYAVMVGINGRPMSLHEAASAYFRGIIELADYQRAVSEGDTRNEWRDAILEQARQIPTAHDFVENHLRGYSDEAAMLAGAAKHGMSPEDVQRLFQNAGRPLTVHQITTGLARGGKFQPIPGEITDPYEASVHEGNLKPSYYDLAIANRYTLPSVFAIRTLAQSGAWDEAKTAQRLKESGWIPEDADEVAKAWAAPKTGATVDPAVKSAETKFITAIHKAVVGGAITEAQGAEQLAITSLTAAAQSGVLAYFMKEHALQQIPPPPTPPA